MTVTLGNLLLRVERDRESDERFSYFMPSASGPCRFGVYNLLHKVLLEETDWLERVRIVASSNKDYFAEMALDFRLRALVAFAASDVLLGGLHHVRPIEREPGLAQAIYDRRWTELNQLIEGTRASSSLRSRRFRCAKRRGSRSTRPAG